MALSFIIITDGHVWLGVTNMNVARDRGLGVQFGMHATAVNSALYCLLVQIYGGLDSTIYTRSIDGAAV